MKDLLVDPIWGRCLLILYSFMAKEQSHRKNIIVGPYPVWSRSDTLKMKEKIKNKNRILWTKAAPD